VPALVALVLAAGPVAVVGETRPALGSLATVMIAGADPGRAAVGIEAAFAAFERVEWSMNEWLPGSPLAELNARAGRGWLRIPGDLCAALEAALDGARRTGGRFDPTWAALSDIWRFDGTRDAPPSDAEVTARCGLVGWRGLEVRRLVPVSGRALSTSGHYEHAYVSGGRRFHHLIDPRTCRPSLASRAVTVLAPTAVEAEIQDKSLFVAGGEDALGLVGPARRRGVREPRPASRRSRPRSRGRARSWSRPAR
jgi:thiamine biosynthesis lipoprotein ApbE